MKVITLNINGIRAGERKGCFAWLKAQQADVVCFQEIKAQEDQIQGDCYHLPGYERFLYPAQKKGYSGVAIYSKLPVEKVHYGLDYSLCDEEGRFVMIDLQDHPVSVASLYLPSCSSKEERQVLKYEFMDVFQKVLDGYKKDSRKYIITGDFNIVHKAIDIKNFKANQKNSGCLPEERAWLDDRFSKDGWCDAFRAVNQEAHQYTWWSNRGRAWDNNVGWRIDYQMVSQELASSVASASIYKDARFSDHAPLIVEYTL